MMLVGYFRTAEICVPVHWITPGASDMALGLVPAAIGIAVFDATGARLRRVPFIAERVKAPLAA